ncbi:T4SS efffector SepA family protein [Rhizobium mongolense]|uniref:Uncharacterized protein n=2 Tax=Rhizobium mongolense TaxID=57676 RepID=A0ABR6IQC1_9HYPH|nr:hypothetical protein [Rhizobium mongolense]MBB4230056.1 hypothetical protein [Rhizobium mongolense]TVZ72813.1 hypothetical protein BCL32_1000 [Rhizobium mongolense USDA 1844]
MPHAITLSDEVFSRLQAHAIPLVDTIESVIIRILDAYSDSKPEIHTDGFKAFDPSLPPNLGHTTVLSASVAGAVLKPADTFWNNIIVVLIKEMAKRGMTPAAIDASITSNSVVGEKKGNGYKFIKEAGVSVQGLDANNAWKTINFLANVTGIPVDVKFRWQNKEGVEMPGVIGAFSTGRTMEKAA